jgi:hypothetical protein
MLKKGWGGAAMNLVSNHFDSEARDLGGGNFLHCVNIEELDDDLVKFIDERIVSICEGCTLTDVAIIKKRLIQYLTPKKGQNEEMGAIAEFFCHLYLGELGFKQEFLYLNLEEGSIKKGFDGYYSKSGETWIFESKSGSITTAGISHKAKVKEGYSDLKGKISGKVKNNPWQNAYSHASQVDVNCDVSIRNQLKCMADDFVLGKYRNIKNFNIMPGSTIFLGGAWQQIDSDDLEEELKEVIESFQFKKIHIVCVNKASVELFWDYLES